MTQTVQLRESATITLNGSGNGIARVGPRSGREVWTPDNVHVSTAQLANAIVNEAECQIFVGNDTSQTNFRDMTVSGSHGDSSDKCNADVIKCGWYIIAQWTGGDIGVSAILTVTGTKTV